MKISSIFRSEKSKLEKKKMKALKKWSDVDYCAPSPHFIKQACVLRNGRRGAQWVETGTFLGETTELLADHGSHVISLEPAESLYLRAKEKFKDNPKVTLLNAASEDVFPQLLKDIQGEVNFWLDGHYSAGDTFQGDLDTPIVDELSCIEKNLGNFDRLVVLVDDVRCFNPALPEYSQYPSLNYLVEWANRCSLDWHIEHDMFVAKSD
jgi:hypothetical protein